MKVERFADAHQLTDGQLITDADGNLWKVFRPEPGGRMWLYEQGDTGVSSFEATDPGDDAPLPWSTVKVVPDDDLPRPTLDPCPVCGKADWPEGGMHAARSIHLRAHERSNSSTMCVCGDMQAGAAWPLAAGNAFAPHLDRKTGKPCPGIPTSEPPVQAESLDWITRGPLTARVEESK
jgi:hypothetical protein